MDTDEGKNFLVPVLTQQVTPITPESTKHWRRVTRMTAEEFLQQRHYENYKSPLHNLKLRIGHFTVQDFSKTL